MAASKAPRPHRRRGGEARKLRQERAAARLLPSDSPEHKGATKRG
jgi:hypothetical protein